jgi:hypothetical protein
MPSIMDLVQEHLGDSGVAQLTQHLGVDQGTAQAAAAAALPMLVNAMSSRTAPSGATNIPTGAGGLAGAAGGLLGNLFGGNHAEVSQQVSQHSGLDIHQAEKALLFLAPIVMAQLQRRQQTAGAGTAAPASNAAAPTAAGAPPGQAPQPAPQQESGLGGVLGAVEKMFHRDQ